MSIARIPVFDHPNQNVWLHNCSKSSYKEQWFIIGTSCAGPQKALGPRTWPIWPTRKSVTGSRCSPVPMPWRGFCGISPPNKLQAFPNWFLKHYKSVVFIKFQNVKPPWTNVMPPYPKLSGDLSGVLSTSFARALLRLIYYSPSCPMQLIIFWNIIHIRFNIFWSNGFVQNIAFEVQSNGQFPFPE